MDNQQEAYRKKIIVLQFNIFFELLNIPKQYEMKLISQFLTHTYVDVEEVISISCWTFTFRTVDIPIVKFF